MRPDPTLIGWYFQRGRQRVGPVRAEAVARLLAAGQLRPLDMLVGISEAEGVDGPCARYSYLDAASVAAEAGDRFASAAQSAAHNWRAGEDGGRRP